jgi:hypothetical protein
VATLCCSPLETQTQTLSPSPCHASQATEAAEDAAIEEQKKEEETAEDLADEIAGELGVGTGTKIVEIAEDTALSVLEHGGSPEEATGAAEEAAEVRSCDPTDPWTEPEPRFRSVELRLTHAGCQ